MSATPSVFCSIRINFLNSKVNTKNRSIVAAQVDNLEKSMRAQVDDTRYPMLVLIKGGYEEEFLDTVKRNESPSFLILVIT
jgi:hypothetical protein